MSEDGAGKRYAKSGGAASNEPDFWLRGHFVSLFCRIVYSELQDADGLIYILGMMFGLDGDCRI